ncbi:MAG: hypothetical protein U1E48_14760 [Paracoccaceae bacterium]
MITAEPTRCRGCGAALDLDLCDFGPVPVAGAGPDVVRLPLRVQVCRACWLCQLNPVPPSASAGCRPSGEAWLAHCRRRAIRLMDELRLGPRSLVAGTGPEDEPLLEFFRGAGVPVAPGGAADLVCSLDGLARAADPLAFAEALAARLAGDAVAILDMPHLLALMRDAQFDRISHARPSYLSLLSLEPLLARAGLRVFDAESRADGGGTLGVAVCRVEGTAPRTRTTVAALRIMEQAAHLDQAEGYAAFGARAALLRDRLVDFLTSAHHGRKTVAVLGPAAAPRHPAELRRGGRACGLCRRGRPPTPGGNPGRHIGRSLRHRGAAPPPAGFRPDPVGQHDRAEVMARLADLRRLGTRFVTAFPDVGVTV